MLKSVPFQCVASNYVRALRNDIDQSTDNISDITREPEADENEKPNLFAVGPLVEDGATRTYYISCGKILYIEEIKDIII